MNLGIGHGLMHPARSLIVVGALLLARPVFADHAVTPYVGYNYGGDSSNCVSLRDCQEKHLNVGLSFGPADGSGFEEDIAFAKNFFGVSPGTDNSVLTVMSNLLIGIPIGPVHPFVVGGVGLIRSHASLALTDLVTSKNAFGYDLGGGVIISLGRRLGVRGDIRRFSTFEDLTLFVFTGGKLNFTRATVGLTFKY
jgi:opacity protein-like surface antigen